MDINITVDDAIEYFQGILDDGKVSGTDFELTEYDKAVYKQTIEILDAYGYEYGYH